MPYFSVCIPQYRRLPFLLASLDSLAQQTFRDFEVCISEDHSLDQAPEQIERRLRDHGVHYRLVTQQQNLKYDANLRAALSLAQGRYCLLMGNDDALAGPNAMSTLHQFIERHGPCGVVIPEFVDYATGRRARRIRRTCNWGGGPEVAARHFRNFSFVSGIVLDRAGAQALATGKWDGAEMYQTYIGSRIIASGMPLLEVAEPLVRKDIVIAGEQVDSYARRPREPLWPIVERRLPLGQLGQLVADAIEPYAQGTESRRLNALIVRQLVRFTYPFWLVELRRVQSLSYAAGVALGFRPSRIAAGMPLGAWRRALLWLEYLAVSVGGLLTPQALFRSMQPALYRLAKKVRG